MAKKPDRAFDVTCPCCRAVLTVDPEVKAVLQHSPPPRTGPAPPPPPPPAARPPAPTRPPPRERGGGPVKGAQAQREARFREAAEAEKSKEQVLARKFEAGLKRAKDLPDPRPPPIDLD